MVFHGLIKGLNKLEDRSAAGTQTATLGFGGGFPSAPIIN
jgi:hypothetical protein